MHRRALPRRGCNGHRGGRGVEIDDARVPGVPPSAFTEGGQFHVETSTIGVFVIGLLSRSLSCCHSPTDDQSVFIVGLIGPDGSIDAAIGASRGHAPLKGRALPLINLRIVLELTHVDVVQTGRLAVLLLQLSLTHLMGLMLLGMTLMMLIWRRGRAAGSAE